MKRLLLITGLITLFLATKAQDKKAKIAYDEILANKLGADYYGMKM